MSTEYEKSKSFQFDGSLSSLVATDTYFYGMCQTLLRRQCSSLQCTTEQLSGRHNILLLMHFDQFSVHMTKET